MIATHRHARPHRGRLRPDYVSRPGADGSGTRTGGSDCATSAGTRTSSRTPRRCSSSTTATRSSWDRSGHRHAVDHVLRLWFARVPVRWRVDRLLNQQTAADVVGHTAAMTSIEQMLHRRNDLSTFLVHFVRDIPLVQSSEQALCSVLANGRIEARNAYGLAARHLDPVVVASQRVVCFTETPLEHSWTMTQELAADRTMKFAPYGLAFTKTFARRNECNPVWYVNHTPGYDWPTKALNAAIATESRPLNDPESIFRVTPFIEQMGTWTTSRKEFWWEREWRRVGDFNFDATHVVAVLAPAARHNDFRAWIDSIGGLAARSSPLPLLDPEWGLERMIAALSGVSPGDIGPFP